MLSCKFCQKEFANPGATGAHAKRCPSNPDRNTSPGHNKGGAKKGNIPWNKGLKGVQTPWNKGKEGTFKGKSHSRETKEKISSKMKGNRNANHRGDRQTFYKDIRMDSKWEAGVAKYLDDNNIEWVYSEKGFELSNGKYYYPDFFIYENGIFSHLIEVKGYFREANKQKFDMFLLEYPDIKVQLWQQDTLKRLDIISLDGKVKNIEWEVTTV